MRVLKWLVPALIATLAAGAAPAGPPVGGVVFVVDGIGGLDPLGRAARQALPKAGLPHEVRAFRWTHGLFRPLRDLQDTRHLLVKAGQLADEVLKVKADDPARPVYLVGHSAGAAVVLAAAEQLPAGTVERIVLLSAAVAPTYDLRRALRTTRGEVVSFSSTWDWFYLGWGTAQFGTADRVYGPSAGMKGFVPPPDLDAEGQALYRRLVQRSWRAEMLLEGRTGGHHGTTAPPFLAGQVAPWLRPAEDGLAAPAPRR